MQHTKTSNVKFIGINGQISLGKENAGKMVSIEHVDDDVWIIKTGKFIPEAQEWLYQNNGVQRLKNALEWAEKNEPSDNFVTFLEKLENDNKD